MALVPVPVRLSVAGDWTVRVRDSVPEDHVLMPPLSVVVPAPLMVPPLQLSPPEMSSVPPPARMPPDRSSEEVTLEVPLKLAVPALIRAVPKPVREEVPLKFWVPLLKSIVVPAAVSKLPVWVPPVVGLIRSVPPAAPAVTCTAPVLLKFAGSSEVMPLPALFLSVPALLNVPFGLTVQSSINVPAVVSCRSNTPPALLLIVALLANRIAPDAAPLSVTTPVLAHVPVS